MIKEYQVALSLEKAQQFKSLWYTSFFYRKVNIPSWICIVFRTEIGIFCWYLSRWGG